MSDHVSTANITRKRGDTHAIQVSIKDAAGAAIDITGFSFLMTVDLAPDPTDSANNLFQLAGVITNAAGGVVQFEPSAVQTDQTPETYYYDVQQTDSGGKIRTILTGSFIIEQDITK